MELLRKMINKTILEKNDYVEYKGNDFTDNQPLYQKCIKDELGKKYFINVNWFSVDLGKEKKHEGWEIKVQFQNVIIDNIEITKNATYFDLPEGIKIEDIETLIEKDWRSLGKPYYERYGD